jgi:hypothetical protein
MSGSHAGGEEFDWQSYRSRPNLCLFNPLCRVSYTSTIECSVDNPQYYDVHQGLHPDGTDEIVLSSHQSSCK